MKERNNKVEKLQNEAIKLIKRMTECWRKDKTFQNEKINAKMNVYNIMKGKYKPVFQFCIHTWGYNLKSKIGKRKSRVSLDGVMEKGVKKEGIFGTIFRYIASSQSI